MKVFTLASSRLKPVLLGILHTRSAGVDSNCGTGFSREGVMSYTAGFRVYRLASSRLKPVLLGILHTRSAGVDCNCGTGFSREGVMSYTAGFRVYRLASSRLKPVLLGYCTPAVLRLTPIVGPALAGKASVVTPQDEGVHIGLFPAEAGPAKECVQRGIAFFIHRLPLAQTRSGRCLCPSLNPFVPPSSFTCGVIA